MDGMTSALRKGTFMAPSAPNQVPVRAPQMMVATLITYSSMFALVIFFILMFSSTPRARKMKP